MDPVDRDEFGLPIPEKYEGDGFTVFDYLSEEYADAETLEEAIALRGAKAFLREATADEFVDRAPDFMKKVGVAQLWAESTWNKDEGERDVAYEQIFASVSKGDVFEVRGSDREVSSWGYSFYSLEGQHVPYSPYHDFDDQFFVNAFQGLGVGERLLCFVTEARCFGEDGIEADPMFCWRVYTCTVTVYRFKVA